MSKRIFITGVAGFLGSNLAQHHLALGDIVHGIDNFSSSKRSSRHLRALKSHKNFMMSELDLCYVNTGETSVFVDFSDVQDILKNGLDEEEEGAYDIVYNFACPASPPIYQRIPIETLLTCTSGVHNLFMGVLRANKARSVQTVIVHASTSEVYGNPIISPQTEDYNGNVHLWGDRSNYDNGKRAAEALCYDFRNKHDLDIRVVRIFNTYGPNMDPDDGRVVTNFVKQAVQGENITLYGNGEQTRSFCYVDDLIAGITTLANLERKESPDSPINLGNPHEFTIRELAQEVLTQIPTMSDIVMKPLPMHDPMQRRPDITRAKAYLKDWEPKVQLAEGLEHLIAYMRQELKVPK